MTNFKKMHQHDLRGWGEVGDKPTEWTRESVVIFNVMYEKGVYRRMIRNLNRLCTVCRHIKRRGNGRRNNVIKIKDDIAVMMNVIKIKDDIAVMMNVILWC